MRLIKFDNKNKSSRILSFHWTNSNEILYITQAGVELYQIIPDKKLVKTLKTYHILVNWAIYQVIVVQQAVI